MWTDPHTQATALQLGEHQWLPAADGAAAGWLLCHETAGGLAEFFFFCFFGGGWIFITQVQR